MGSAGWLSNQTALKEESKRVVQKFMDDEYRIVQAALREASPLPGSPNMSQFTMADGVDMTVAVLAPISSARVGTSDVVLTPGNYVFSITGTAGTTVKIPGAVWTQLSAVAMSAAPLSPGLVTTLQKVAAFGSSLPILAARPITVSLFNSNGTSLMSTLVEPILITFSGFSNTTAVDCVYWDLRLSRWSQQGLTQIDVVNGSIVCSTTHLSIFAAIERVSDFTLGGCADKQFSMKFDIWMSLISSHSTWWHEVPAIVLWSILAGGFLLMVLMKFWDRRSTDMQWMSQVSYSTKAQDRGEKPKQNATHGCCAIPSILKPLPSQSLEAWIVGFDTASLDVEERFTSQPLAPSYEGRRQQAQRYLHAAFLHRVATFLRILHPFTELVLKSMVRSHACRCFQFLLQLLMSSAAIIFILQTCGCLLRNGADDSCSFAGTTEVIATSFAGMAIAEVVGRSFHVFCNLTITGEMTADSASFKAVMNRWKCRVRFTWIFGSLLFIASIVLDITLLAQVSEASAQIWLYTFLLTLFHILASVPLFKAVLYSILSAPAKVDTDALKFKQNGLASAQELKDFGGAAPVIDAEDVGSDALRKIPSRCGSGSRLRIAWADSTDGLVVHFFSHDRPPTQPLEASARQLPVNGRQDMVRFPGIIEVDEPASPVARAAFEERDSPRPPARQQRPTSKQAAQIFGASDHLPSPEQWFCGPSREVDSVEIEINPCAVVSTPAMNWPQFNNDPFEGGDTVHELASTCQKSVRAEDVKSLRMLGRVPQLQLDEAVVEEDGLAIGGPASSVDPPPNDLASVGSSTSTASHIKQQRPWTTTPMSPTNHPQTEAKLFVDSRLARPLNLHQPWRGWLRHGS